MEQIIAIITTRSFFLFLLDLLTKNDTSFFPTVQVQKF